MKFFELIFMSHQKTSPVSSIVLALPVAIIGTTQSLLVIALPIFVVLTELKIGQLSPILGLSALAYLMGGYLWPKKAVPGYRRQLLKQLLIAATISQILFVAALFASTQEVLGTIALLCILFVTRFAYGLTVSGVYPTIQAWLVIEHAESTHARHQALTHMSATISVGRILIPLIAAGLIIYQPEMILGLLIGLPIAALLLLPREQVPRVHKSPVTTINLWPDKTIAIPTILTHMSLGLTEFIIGPYLSVEWNTTLDNTMIYTALFLANIAACMLLTQLVSLRYRPDPGFLLIWSPVGIAFGTTLAAIYPATLPFGLILMAISLALLLPASAAGAAAGRNINAQTKASADLYTTRIFGHLLGVTVAGPLFEITSHLPLFAAAALALAAIPTSAGLRRALATHT